MHNPPLMATAMPFRVCEERSDVAISLSSERPYRTSLLFAMPFGTYRKAVGICHSERSEESISLLRSSLFEMFAKLIS